MNYAKHVSTKKTVQTKPIPGKNQVENNAGGFVFKLDRHKQLLRFLILGSEGGTYYVKEDKLTVENAKNIIKLIKEDGVNVVNTIVEVSRSGRAPKNDAAIFALALVATHGDKEGKAAAYNAITQVCRIGTHLFTFVQAIQDMRGWSAGLRKGVSKFYTERSPDNLAKQLIKYRQRNGWTHRDVLRLSHPTPSDAEQNKLFKWVVGKSKMDEHYGPLVQAFETLQNTASEKSAAALIKEHSLPREAVPTELLNSKVVWEALLEDMPMTAMIRNLGKMSAIGLFESALGKQTKKVIEKLSDKEEIKASRVHPVAILTALKTYQKGHGDKGSLTWPVNQAIVDALDEAFYTAFGNVTPTGKNIMYGLDVSGSMSSNIAGSIVTAAEMSAVMAMVSARVEKNTEFFAFSNEFVPVTFGKKDRLDKILTSIYRMNFGTTDCSLPMEYAIKKGLYVDTFVVLTDNETYAGKRHPIQALADYRKKFNPNAKLVVVGMSASNFTIADPLDSGMLDVCGADTATPEIISSFIKGDL